MNICVYGASSNNIDKSYIEATENLGRCFGAHGHGIVFGGGAGGLMGAAARGTYEGGGKVIGVAPSFFNVDGAFFEHCTEFYYPDNMRERKKMLEEMSDAFVVAPGGIGTFDEFFEILTLRQLNRHNKAIALFNVNGYFDHITAMIENAIKEGFVTENCKELYEVISDPQELVDYLEGYTPKNISVYKLKDI